MSPGAATSPLVFSVDGYPRRAPEAAAACKCVASKLSKKWSFEVDLPVPRLSIALVRSASSVPSELIVSNARVSIVLHGSWDPVSLLERPSPSSATPSSPASSPASLAPGSPARQLISCPVSSPFLHPSSSPSRAVNIYSHKVSRQSNSPMLQGEW
jgi:hypothetical protein